MRRPIALGLLLAAGLVHAAEGASDAAARLAAIHDDLVALRFEVALAGVETLLAEPALAEGERAEALVLRSQAHVALGDLKATEQDYREILKLRPGYVPEESLTPAKARERFDRVRRELVGRLVPRLTPAEARLTVDGREVAVDATGGVALLAGEHLVRAERTGFDALEQVVTIAAAKDAAVELRLVPNARPVVLLTEPDGVEILLDGVAVGRTERPRTAGSTGVAPAELAIENVPLGEHVFELGKYCFKSERRRELLAVDLLDPGPRRYEVVRLVPARGRLAVVGGPPGAGLLVDDEPAGSLPLAPLDLCPGPHRVVLSHGGRRVWVSSEAIEASAERVVEVAPRPNAVLVGSEDWPPGLESFARTSRIPAAPPPARADLSDARGWAALDLPRDADLALAVTPPRRPGARGTVYLYSPILGIVERIEAAPALDPQRWTRPSFGLAVADSRVGGGALVVEVRRDGPAAAAGIAIGERVVAAGGVEVRDAAGLRLILDAASSSAPLELGLRRADGTRAAVKLQAASSPDLRVEPGAPVEAMVRAAWAAVDGAVLPAEEAAPALANLALLLSAFGRHPQALDTWTRVRFATRAGVGMGTVSYHRGVALAAAGRTREAAAAFGEAAASSATAFDDEGPPVAPAARDRLHDLEGAAGR